MPNTFVISDSHFYHANIIEYCRRPFSSVEEMNDQQILRWNAVVAPEDTVIHLGDFIMGVKENIHALLPRLNGNIILCRGNHETKHKFPVYAEYPDKITVKDIHYLPYKGLYFIFCHFPNGSEEFAQMITENNSEVIWCHGHVHDNAPFFTPSTRTFNCSADVTDFAPVSLDTMYRLATSGHPAFTFIKGGPNGEIKYC